MNYGYILPSGDARRAAEMAHAAESAGWDAFFVWDSVWGIDPWVALAAAAMRTERIRLGTMLTPPSRRRPWKLAGETATLDNLSGGRMILSVGLGAPDTGFEAFGEVTDRKTRAELLDESLAIITGLWQGQPFNFEGKHYQVKETTFMPPPPPVQKPRIPIWVVGAWPKPKSMQRALRWDGLLPNMLDVNNQHVKPGPEDIRIMKEYIEKERQALGLTGPYDIVVEGQTPSADRQVAAAAVQPWIDAGATWWLESNWEAGSEKEVDDRIHQGPPRP